VIVAVAVSGILGATIMLCFISDLLSLATMHISVFYGLASKWHGVQVHASPCPEPPSRAAFRARGGFEVRGRVDEWMMG